MTCPPEIAQVLLQILSHASLCIRALGWNGDAERCTIIADHIHNLPGLIADYSPERLRYYWTVERPSFERRFPATSFQPYWSELSRLMPTDTSVEASSSR